MSIANLLIVVINFYSIVILVRAIFSWVPPRYRANAPYEYIVLITEPVLKPARRLIPPSGGVDWSPIVVFIALRVLREFVV